MKIQPWLATVTLAVALPQLAGLVAYDAWSRHKVAGQFLGSMLEQLTDEVRDHEACTTDPTAFGQRGPRRGPPVQVPYADPGRFDGMDPPPPDGPGGPGGPGGPPRHDHPSLTAFNASGRAAASEVADRPELADLDLAVGEVASLPTPFWSSRIELARRTGWGDACEIVVIQGSANPGFMGSVLPSTPTWLLPTLLVATVMFLAVGPPVRRLRRLTEAVRRGDTPVAQEGSDEIAELSQAFDAAHVALLEQVEARKAREQALRDFIANTAHDVRIPLTVLLGHLAALEKGHHPDTVRHAADEAQYLGALLDNLATHARMEASLAQDPVDLVALVDRVVARHRPVARRAEIHLVHGVPEEPVVVLGDMTAVEQAVSNLVYNAVRHNQPGGHVAVTLDQHRNGVDLVVADDGPGVAPEELARLTERGYRGTKARGRDEVGQGLGLAIVRRVADGHHWHFDLRLNDPHGLVATLAIPVS